MVIIKCIQPQDWFAAIDLKDAAQTQVTQTVPKVYVRGSGIAVQGPPFGLSLSPRVFMKVVEGALAPLREVGIRILN